MIIYILARKNFLGEIKMFWDKLALLLTIIGGINWGLVGAFHFDLVQFIFAFAPILASIVYIAVGVAACYTLYAYLIK